MLFCAARFPTWTQSVEFGAGQLKPCLFEKTQGQEHVSEFLGVCVGEH